MASQNVVVENVRLNDFHYAADASRIGAKVEGNYHCDSQKWSQECCFCKPNGVRTSQVGVWIPQTRDADVGVFTSNVHVRNVVSRSSQADAVNLHGNVRDVMVEDSYFANTGDDVYVLWGASNNPENVTFRNVHAYNPGVLRPGWYGNCVATYGLRSILFDNITCQAPTLGTKAIPSPGTDDRSRIDSSMFVFYTSFGGTYPPDNNLTINGCVDWSCMLRIRIRSFAIAIAIAIAKVY